MILIQKVLQLFGVMRAQPNGPGRKDQLLEICSMAAVRQTNHLRGIERPLRRTAFINTQPLHESTYGALSSMTELRWRNPNKSSLHNVIQNRRTAEAVRKPFFPHSNVHNQPNLILDR